MLSTPFSRLQSLSKKYHLTKQLRDEAMMEAEMQ
jgi:hypothetical protein